MFEGGLGPSTPYCGTPLRVIQFAAEKSVVAEAKRSMSEPIALAMANRMEPLVGFEPTTYSLQVSCSTTELKRRTYGFCGCLDDPTSYFISGAFCRRLGTELKRRISGTRALYIFLSEIPSLLLSKIGISGIIRVLFFDDRSGYVF